VKCSNFTAKKSSRVLKNSQEIKLEGDSSMKETKEIKKECKCACDCEGCACDNLGWEDCELYIHEDAEDGDAK
jgi:hypothetical protein